MNLVSGFEDWSGVESSRVESSGVAWSQVESKRGEEWRVVGLSGVQYTRGQNREELFIRLLC